MVYLKCETRGCRAEKHLELCMKCDALVCQAHAMRTAGGIVCQSCAAALGQAFHSVCEKAQVRKPQAELFA